MKDQLMASARYIRDEYAAIEELRAITPRFSKESYILANWFREIIERDMAFSRMLFECEKTKLITNAEAQSIFNEMRSACVLSWC